MNLYILCKIVWRLVKFAINSMQDMIMGWCLVVSPNDYIRVSAVLITFDMGYLQESATASPHDNSSWFSYETLSKKLIFLPILFKTQY